MANSSHVSSPEKPQRSMPQHHRTDSVKSTGIHPAWRTNSSLSHESGDLRMTRRRSVIYATLVQSHPLSWLLDLL